MHLHQRRGVKPLPHQTDGTRAHTDDTENENNKQDFQFRPPKHIDIPTILRMFSLLLKQATREGSAA